MKLIINADDFGFSESVNKGIEYCLDNNLVTSASVMVNAEYANHALEICKSKGYTNIGVHLNLTYGKPILAPKQIKSLVDEKGVFHYMCSLGYWTKYEDAKKELKAQIEKFLSFGIKPSHLDYHHYFHEVPVIYKALVELAKEYNLPIRAMTKDAQNYAKENGVKTADAFCFSFHDWGATVETLQELCNQYGKSDLTIELMTTPGFIDDYTRIHTTYLYREDEIEELKKAKELNVFKDIELINFNDL
ncbi:MAG: ChbG/HpnK family deacetylase [Clostridia bacterium]|nr:ChbG/HpnK family deacetylase [Clostridia bacterium]